MFHAIWDPNTSAEVLNHDLTKFSELASRWKMSFNLDPSKQAEEVLFSNKATKTNHPNIIFNGNAVQNSANQKKRLGLIFDEMFNETWIKLLMTILHLNSPL